MYLVNGGGKVLVAKYYPGTGWYVPKPERFGEKLNEAFNQADFGKSWEEGMPSIGGLFGDCGWRIEYEIVDGVSDDDAAQAKASILSALSGIGGSK